MLPGTDSEGSSLAHVGLGDSLEGLVGAAVLVAGEQAVALTADNRFPVPAMPPAETWHKRAISVGCRCVGDGFDGDRDQLGQVVESRAERRFAARTARGVLAQEWGSVYVLSDRLLREGLLLEAEVDELLHPERASEERREAGGQRLYYDASATTAGLMWTGSAPPGAEIIGRDQVAAGAAGGSGRSVKGPVSPSWSRSRPAIRCG